MMRFLKIIVLFLPPFLYADPWDGADYAKNSSLQAFHADRFLRHLSLAEDDLVLDIGCGDGKITALVAQKVPHGFAIGIDPSDSMLAAAEITLQKNGLSNLQFIKSAAENFSYKEQFDHIISFYTMHWIKDQDAALKNFYRHLKPEGKIHLLFSPSKEGLPFQTALHKTVAGWPSEDFEGFVNTQYIYDTESYRKLLIQAGFHVEAIQYLYHEVIHENKDALKNWIKQWLPQGKYLSLEKQDRFLQELIRNYLIELHLSPDAAGSVRWGEYLLIAEASKK